MVRKLAGMQDRHFVVMKLQANLLKESRAKSLEGFPADKFRRIANVVVGEPTAEFVKNSQTLNLQAKQEQSDREFKTAQMQKKNARLAEKRKKDTEKLMQKKNARLAEKRKKE